MGCNPIPARVTRFESETHHQTLLLPHLAGDVVNDFEKNCMCSGSQSKRHKERRQHRINAGLCIDCGKVPPVETKRKCESCNERCNEAQARYHKKNPDLNKTYRWRIKLEVLTAYGGACTCCGERRPEFLCIDHVNKDGAKHRKETFGRKSPGSFEVYLWIRRNNFPSDLQVLCYNCNMASFIFGECPHRRINNGEGTQKTN